MFRDLTLNHHQSVTVALFRQIDNYQVKSVSKVVN